MHTASPAAGATGPDPVDPWSDDAWYDPWDPYGALSRAQQAAVRARAEAWAQAHPLAQRLRSGLALALYAAFLLLFFVVPFTPLGD